MAWFSQGKNSPEGTSRGPSSLEWIRRKAAFRYPVGEAPRTAVLVPWFRKGFRNGVREGLRKRNGEAGLWSRIDRTPPVRVFPKGWSVAAAEFAPSAIVGTRDQLLALALDDPPELWHAVIVVARVDDPLLTQDDLELLWRAFEVPVFEQVIGSSGELLAAECEAHAGLHIEASSDARCLDLLEAWSGRTLDDAPCGCGRKSPRLIRIATAERIRTALAAS